MLFNNKRTCTKSLCVWLITGALFLGFISISSCKKDLETKVYGSLSPESLYKSELDFNSAVIGLYSPFSTDWGQGDPSLPGTWYNNMFNYVDWTYPCLSSTTTDELVNISNANIQNFTWGAATQSGSDPIYYRIRYVARATDVIANISKSTASTEAIRKKYIGEAKVLRAWLSFMLYDFYGPVNAKFDENTLSDATATVRPTAVEFSAQIEKDLLEAAPDLPDNYNNNDANWGRMSKGFADLLLLRLYMHDKNWAKAEAVGKQMGSLGYSLQTKYASAFNSKANTEIIYAIPSSTAQPNWYMQLILPGDLNTGYFGDGTTITVPSGWYSFYMPWNFYDKFESNDKRKSTIIDHYTDANGGVHNRTNGMKGAVPLKYTALVGSTSPQYPLDWVVARYSEVLLSLAEAINEQRGPVEAFNYVNQVRARAGVTPFAGFTQQQLRDSLLEERGKEFFSEGLRRSDLIRQGRFIQYAKNRGVTLAQDYNVLFPIPSDVIIQGKGVIIQNSGY